MNITTVGLDIAKHVFFVVGADCRGRQVMRKKLRRGQLIEFFTQLAPCRVGIEACGGSQYWARRLRELGHEVKLVHPRHVKAFLRAQKNDYNDAAAVCEAGAHPEVRGAPIKSETQQDLQALQRVRQARVRERTATVNRVRGLLAERGIVMAKQIEAFRRAVPEVLEDGENGLSECFRALVGEEYARVCTLDKQVKELERALLSLSRQDPAFERLQAVPGFGPVVASALLGAVGDARAFAGARELAAWLGLVPRQYTTGGKPRLMGITKRGDKYLRALLVHGARSVVRHATHKDDALSVWVRGVEARRGKNVAVVALANKLARIAWVILARGEDYRPARAMAH